MLVSVTTAAYGHATMATRWRSLLSGCGSRGYAQRAAGRQATSRRVRACCACRDTGSAERAASRWGYLTFLGAALFVLGVRSRQRVAWVSRAVTAVAGVLTGSSVVRDAVGIHEYASAAATSTVVQASLGLVVLLLTVRVFMVERDRPPTVSGSIGHK
ncbi:hypothetical protein ONR57_01505 [Hoyosella sp. YIM 151337]|uniref:hypothetical protein n=1 Tax=Hoyosella sp. YIM 151337 TaxID=2992742 RepID=UPI002235C5D9|nr:hypothetical protein [Hoyosella sp. YIM 151337]MCW4351975.1 hypothetical protein [Hoyosella sp. YIM 151337]